MVRCKSLVLAGVSDHEQVRLARRLAAKSKDTLYSIIREPDGGLLEQSRAVNDGNGGIGCSADVRGKLGQPVEHRLRLGIDNLV